MGIYLDHAATTAVRPEVAEAMRRHLEVDPGNPSSGHGPGRAARAALEEARERVAGVLGGARAEVVFTAGGTEAANLAVLGRWRAVAGGRRGAAVVCSAVEHRAVLGAVEAAARMGAEALVLGVDGSGRVAPGALEEALAADPAVVSVMWANNEVGTVQPTAEIGERCRAAGVAHHSDAVQAFGRVPVRVDRTACDLVSISAHKIGGPCGVGALWVRSGVELEPLTYGGGQERGLRAGTENVAAAVGFAVAAERAEAEREAEAVRVAGLRDRLEATLRDVVADLRVNGAGAERVPHITSLSIGGVETDLLRVALDLEGVAVSSGSACRSGAAEPSHVLVAMGCHEPGRAAIRLSLGRTTTPDQVDAVAAILPRVVARLRGSEGA